MAAVEELAPPPLNGSEAPDGARLKILFFTWDYYPVAAGGAERQARLQAEELVRRGHHVTVVCPRTSGVGGGEVGGVVVHRLFRVDGLHLRRVTYLVSIVWFMLRRARKFDIVHVHLANLQADVVVFVARMLRLPTYVKVACGGVAGEVLRLGKVAWATRWYGLRHANVVQALSSEIEGELGTIGIDSRRIRRVPNGVDLDGFMPASTSERAELRMRLGLPVEKTICLFVGRFAAYKGLGDLLAVWGEGRGDALLVLVGTADTDRPMEPPIRESEHLIVRGWTDAVPDYLRAADVFVYPSLADGMSNAVMEAMSCGLTVVASRSGATAELAVDGVGALLFDPGDRSALGAALDTALESSERRRALGSGARTAIERFGIGRVVSEIEREYRELVVSR